MKEYPYLSQAIGNAIEIFRNDKRMTKSALADFSCLERKYLREIECGEKRPTVNAVYSICEALNISPLEFFRKVEEERERLRKELLKS
ncbi:MAG: helix-turn-helix transcriptional regulator [Desulfovibrionaceae bacterium]|nr:helix-turn-helix transcriptional regulator [Desulfovibrionaceae bacterium]